MSNNTEEKKPESCDYDRRAREHTVAGGALGAVSVGGLAVFGSVACPLCLVAAPALLCSGAWNAHKSRKQNADDEDAGRDGTADITACEE